MGPYKHNSISLSDLRVKLLLLGVGTGSSGTPSQETYHGGQVIANQLTLVDTPDIGKAIPSLIINTTVQNYGLDYTLAGNVITFIPSSLNFGLDSNDYINIIFKI
jgi:hypothetical protein